MENTELMVNEETTELSEEVETTQKPSGWKIAAGVGLAGAALVLVYKKLVKPVAAKIKAKKADGKAANAEGELEDLDVEIADESEK